MSDARRTRPPYVYLIATPVSDGSGWHWSSFIDRPRALRAFAVGRGEDLEVGDGRETQFYRIGTGSLNNQTARALSASTERSEKPDNAP